MPRTMDDRYPKFLKYILRKLDFLGLPNLAFLICGLAVLGFIGKNMLGMPIDRFLFDPQLLREGEWWRLFAYPADSGDNPFWLLFYLMYIYFVVGALESHWGPGPTTIFTLLCYVCTVASAFIFDRPVSIWFYVLENIGFAFGTLFPEVEFLIFFILPVKAKWVALFFAAVFALQFISGSWETKLFLLGILFPYFLFFGKMQYMSLRDRKRLAKHKSNFDRDMWR